MPSSLTLDDVIERDPDKVSGTCVFRDSRLPVMTLFDNLDAGETVDDFMENYPGVPREYIDIVLLPENRERVAAIVEADRKEDRRAWEGPRGKGRPEARNRPRFVRAQTTIDRNAEEGFLPALRG